MQIRKIDLEMVGVACVLALGASFFAQRFIPGFSDYPFWGSALATSVYIGFVIWFYKRGGTILE